MMRLLTSDADLRCDHVVGRVVIAFSQTLVTVDGREVLVENDPQGRPIKACPHAGMGIVPCNLTLAVQRGYSNLLTVDGRRACLDTVTGLTNGTPHAVNYTVHDAGQELISSED